MRACSAFSLLAACLLAPGCAQVRTGTEADPTTACSSANDWLVDKIFEMQAEQAWMRFRHDARAQAMSEDYGEGFKQGYIASLRRSGWVETPTTTID